MNAYLLPKTVGSAWQTLPLVIQRHYAVQEGQGSSLVGVMTIAYPHFMLPLIGLISCFGAAAMSIPVSRKPLIPKVSYIGTGRYVFLTVKQHISARK